MALNVNTKNSLMKNSGKTNAELQKELTAVAKRMGVKEVKITIPEVFKASLGDPAMFTVNAIRVEIPLGVEVSVPEPHALHAGRLMKGAVMVKGQERPKPEDIYNK